MRFYLCTTSPLRIHVCFLGSPEHRAEGPGCPDLRVLECKLIQLRQFEFVQVEFNEPQS